MSEEYIFLEYAVKETQPHTTDEIDQDLEERIAMLRQFSKDIGFYDASWDCFMDAGKYEGTILSHHLFYLIFKKDKPTDKRFLEILSVLQKEPLSKVVGNRNGIYFELNSVAIINQEEANYLLVNQEEFPPP